MTVRQQARNMYVEVNAMFADLKADYPAFDLASLKWDKWEVLESAIDLTVKNEDVGEFERLKAEYLKRAKAFIDAWRTKLAKQEGNKNG